MTGSTVGKALGLGAVAGCRYLVAQRFVRALEVVLGAVAVEGALNFRVAVPDGTLAEQLQLEAAVKAFVLALSLRMEWSDVRDRDAEADETGRKAGMEALAARAPGRK